MLGSKGRFRVQLGEMNWCGGDVRALNGRLWGDR